MVSLACPACGEPVPVNDDFAGEHLQCSGCGKLIPVPATGATECGGSRPSPEPTIPFGASTVAHPEPDPSPEQNRPPAGTEESEVEEDARSHYDFLAPAERPDEIGRLGGFRILTVLGCGGMGVVFQAEDPKLERRLAIKAMLPKLAASGSAHKRFLREARTAAAIEHDHIVPILQVGEDRGVPFFAMPFLKGESLDHRLKREGALPLAEVVRIGRETVEGLAAAHEHGLIHRDIKPANLWLESPRGRVKILDFGLARAATASPRLTRQGAIVGTPAYMAPEQGAGEAVDHRCDLFSLGCVLYQCCTGRMPFRGKDTVTTLLAVATTNPPPPSELRPEVPAALSDLVMQLLAKKPEDRPESARAVAERLAALPLVPSADGAPPGTAGPSPQRDRTTNVCPGPAPERGRRTMLAAVVLLALVAVGIGVAFGLKSRTGTVLVNLTEPDVEVLINGAVKSAGPSPEGVRLELRPGEYLLTVKRGAEELFSSPVSVQGGAEVVLDAKWAPKTYTNSLGMEFVLVPRGRAWLGGGDEEPGDREVVFAHDFYLGKYEVTQEEWEKVMGTTPSNFSRNGSRKEWVKHIPDAFLRRFPVEGVSWDDTQVFLELLNQSEKQEGWVYRLPREVEWEYACRGGPVDRSESVFDFYLEKPSNVLQPDQATFVSERGVGRPFKVGSYRPNRLGLYDMHGNVWEWCEDSVKGRDGTQWRVYKGGGFNDDAADCRAAGRHTNNPGLRNLTLGLRVARVPEGSLLVK
jgi:formylglycine-generating enzyme required for sulfatase activity